MLFLNDISNTTPNNSTGISFTPWLLTFQCSHQPHGDMALSPSLGVGRGRGRGGGRDRMTYYPVSTKHPIRLVIVECVSLNC